MADDFEMRARLQQVAAYRELCRGVRWSGRENIVFALIMLFLAYVVWQNGAPPLVLTLYVILAVGELLVGLFKWVMPSAEGVLLDGIVLLVFALYNFGIEYLRFQVGRQFSPVIVFLGLFLLIGAFGRFKAYGQLRLLFADRPSAEHMAWFDDLTREIQASDPQSDELTLDLPTSPHWKVKLLGTTAFFVSRKGNMVLVAGPHDFELLREKADHGTGRRKGLLRIHDMPYPEFEITDATWANYQKWRAANPLQESGDRSQESGKPVT
jgi:hypothetical protein